MTGFDIAVLIVVGFGAVTGFMRGFVQEILVLLAWAVAIMAIRMFHPMVSAAVLPWVHTTSGAWVLAYAILLIVPYAVTRFIARQIGKASRNSLIGPIDRVLGFGFGAVKGTLIVVLVFAVVTLGYDIAWGRNGRPAWITESRTYPFINACNEKLLKVLAERRAGAGGKADEAEEPPADEPAAGETPAARPKRRHRTALG